MLRVRDGGSAAEGATMATLMLQEAPALAEALAKLAPGETISIMDGGREVARVAPAAPTPDEMIALIRELRRGRILGDVSLKALIEEGRE
jgi:antitoxin (DNA-binding transcriptional repressor) of toxin-antitoxin stability system